MISNRKKQNIITIGVITIGGFFVLLGLSHGEYVDVLNKAIYICLECIGIG